MKGRCSCGAVGYRLTLPPLFTHACHCSWCQRESGSAFALNALIETDRLKVSGQVEEIALPSASGKGQTVARCPICRVALYSHYAGVGRKLAFVRVDTLENPGACPPDIHIFTSTKLAWLALPEGARVVPEYYRRRAEWPAASLARWDALISG
ncbi:MAG: GFA family protein [Rhodobacteraceae bacterium]|nr:GFA family protein [Paracoccaceae bacterium]